jgi:hypothetical protein
MAAQRGSARKAADVLQGRIPAETLRYWAETSHKDRYLQIRNEVVPAIHAKLAAELEDTARHALERTNTAMDVAGDELQAAETADTLEDRARRLNMANTAGTLARNLATIGGITAQHVRPMRDMPTAVVEHRTADQALKRLRAIQATIEGTCQTVEGGAGAVESEEA